MTVTIFGKPACGECNKTKSDLNKLGINYSVVDLTQDDNARENFMAMGYMSAPIVEVDKGDGSVDRWAGYIPELIKELSES